MCECEHSTPIDDFKYARTCNIIKIKDYRGESKVVCFNWGKPEAVETCSVKKEYDKIKLEDCLLDEQR